MVPGTRALGFAARWFDPQTVHGTFEPLIADWQREWQDAPPARRSRISIRALAAFLCAIVVSSPRIVRTPAPRGVWLRVVARMAAVMFLVAALLFVPYLRDFGSDRWGGALFMLIIPSMITLGFPFGIIGAVDAIRRHEPLPKHVERAAAVKLGIAALAIMMVFGGWLVPASNQAWRVAVAAGRYAPAPGLRELSTYQLMVDPSLKIVPGPGVWQGPRPLEIRRELNNRASLALLPLLLLWGRWRALDLPSGRWYSARSTALGTLLMFFSFMFVRFNARFIEEGWHLPVGCGPLLTLAILASAGLIRIKWAAIREARA
jgi:hypothetical protein